MSGSAALKGRACEAVDAWAGRLWETSLAIHREPELGYQEHRTAARLCSLLEDGGLAVERGLAEMPTAFRATVHGAAGAPIVALLAEMDALPGMGHGCGHNLIGTAAAGAGIALATVAEELEGSAVVLGCPAEESNVEGSGGKVRLLDAGIFDGVCAAIMVHPGTVDYICVTREPDSRAACGLAFEFTGKAAHAGMNPHMGIDALAAVLQLFNGIALARSGFPPDASVHGIITDGGRSPGIIPERAACRFGLRARNRDELRTVRERLIECARGAAQALGAGVEVRPMGPLIDEVRHHPAVASALKANLDVVGREMCTWLPPGPLPSTDFGNVSQVVPAASAGVAIADASVALHSPEFVAAAAGEPARRMLIDSAKALAMTAIDLLGHPEIGGRAAFHRSGESS